MQVLTFDFHNTLANCDPWFELEVRGLPWAVIERLDLDIAAPAKVSIDEAYRRLRLDVIASGNEVDAYDAVSALFDEFRIRSTRPAIDAAVDQLMRESLEAMIPVPGAVDTVQALRAAGVRLGVVSSAVHHLTLTWVLDRLGILGCFDAVVSSASSGYYKSSPAIFEFALRDLRGRASGSVHVGDSLKWDVDTAQRAGMTAVWLNTRCYDVFAASGGDCIPSLTLSGLVDAAPALLDLLERVRPSIDA